MTLPGVPHTIAALLAVLWVSVPVPARGEPQEVDLALVLAVDISLSMDVEEQSLQREGFVGAFRSAIVHEAIAKGMLGRIAVTYVEWAGHGIQQVVLPWTIIESPDDALSFADRLSRTPPRRAVWTSISDAIDFSVGLLAVSNVQTARQVIDVSGDGANNQGRPVTLARDDALAKGITINGLPIMLQRPSTSRNMENLDLYYRDCVIGGLGAFLQPVREREHFAEAIKNKLVREIAGSSAEQMDLTGLVHPAQGDERANSFAGEERRRAREP